VAAVAVVAGADHALVTTITCTVKTETAVNFFFLNFTRNFSENKPIKLTQNSSSDPLLSIEL
jgi:hypothetical protein